MAKNKYIIINDYISGQEVKDTPEELEATQVFSKMLVEEYGYSKEYIQTRPQYFVRRTPSDEIKKKYPIDIAVFCGNSRVESDLIGIVECKKKTRNDGIEQLKLYMDMCSNVQWGVWFNGEEQINLQKIKKDGDLLYSEIPNIPKQGQRIEDIGKYKRKDLKPVKNLKNHFKVINNYLYGNMKEDDTSTRNRAKQIINLLFCKIYDEQYTGKDEDVLFRAGAYEEKEIVEKRIKDLFIKVKARFSDVFEEGDSITLDPDSIIFTVGQLQELCITESERDVIGDAFEVFVSKALKDDEGQFFTPRNVIKMMVDIIDPDENSMIIDPACGTGGFLIESLRHVWGKLETKALKLGWSEKQLEKEKQHIATTYFRGIDKDLFVAKVTKAYMAIIGDGRGGVFCENSLEVPKKLINKCQDKIDLEKFDVVLTNPPFGSKIPIRDEKILKQFDLGHKWKFIKEERKWELQTTLNNKSSKGGIEPQILFIERCLQLLKNNGKMGIVLPDGFFSKSETYIRHWLLKKVKIIGIIDVCRETFQPNTSTKTSILFFEKSENIPKNYEIFMGVAYFCGHNRRGQHIEKDDIPEIITQFKKWKNNETIENTKNTFIVHLKDLEETNFWMPKHFSPYYTQAIDNIKTKYEIVKLRDIADFKKGSEPGSDKYINFIDRNDTDIPFIRTGDLVNFSVNQTPDNFIDEDIFLEYNQNLQENDILFTKDGKIGITAMITKNDKVMIASGILRIRLKQDAVKKYGITPEYLFAVLSNKYTGYFQAIRSTVIAATISHLHEERIENFDIPIIDKKTINELTKIVKESFELKNRCSELDLKTTSVLKTFF